MDVITHPLLTHALTSTDDVIIWISNYIPNETTDLTRKSDYTIVKDTR